MEIITVRLPRRIVALIDTLVEEGYFASRSAAIREALRLLLKHYETLIERVPERRLLLATP